MFFELIERTYPEIVWLGADWTARTRANANRTTGLPNSYDRAARVAGRAGHCRQCSDFAASLVLYWSCIRGDRRSSSVSLAVRDHLRMGSDRQKRIFAREAASVPCLKLNWLVLPVYRTACSELGEVVGERVQDLIGGLGPGERPGLSFQVAIQSLMSFSRACTEVWTPDRPNAPRSSPRPWTPSTNSPPATSPGPASPPQPDIPSRPASHSQTGLRPARQASRAITRRHPQD